MEPSSCERRGAPTTCNSHRERTISYILESRHDVLSFAETLPRSSNASLPEASTARNVKREAESSQESTLTSPASQVPGRPSRFCRETWVQATLRRTGQSLERTPQP